MDCKRAFSIIQIERLLLPVKWKNWTIKHTKNAIMNQKFLRIRALM